MVKSLSGGNGEKLGGIQHSSPSSGGGSSGAKGNSPIVAGLFNGGKRSSSGIMEHSMVLK